MEARPGQRALDLTASQVYDLGQAGTSHFFEEHTDNIMGSADPFDAQISESLRRSSLVGTPINRHGPQDSKPTAGHCAFPVAACGTGISTSTQASKAVYTGCGTGNTSAGSYASLANGSNCNGGENRDYYHFSHVEAHGSFSPDVVVDTEREQDEQSNDLRKESCTLGPTQFQRSSPSWRWQKASDELQSHEFQLAEEAFAQIKFWREVFAAFTGMHGVYVLANFAFDNPAGGICSLFCFLCSTFAQLDRRAPSYFLTALLSFCLGVVVAVSLITPVRGFEIYFENKLLRRICVTQICLLLLGAPVAVVVALRIKKLHSFLREPGVLVPLELLEQSGDTPQAAASEKLHGLAETTNGFQPSPNSASCASPVGSPGNQDLSDVDDPAQWRKLNPLSQQDEAARSAEVP